MINFIFKLKFVYLYDNFLPIKIEFPRNNFLFCDSVISVCMKNVPQIKKPSDIKFIRLYPIN